jgi:hypothetical protein
MTGADHSTGRQSIALRSMASRPRSTRCGRRARCDRSARSEYQFRIGGLRQWARAAVADMPGVNRIFVTFTDADGVLRGETSVVVRTQ